MGACASRDGQQIANGGVRNVDRSPIAEDVHAQKSATNLESKDIWFDDEYTPGVPATVNAFNNSASKLDVAASPAGGGPSKSRRRRLSVSTIESRSPNEELAEGDPSTAPSSPPKRTQIVKHEDPVKALMDRNHRGLKEVTLSMLKELFPAAEHYAVFGSPSYSVQRGFDNKVTEIGGGMPPGRTLRDIGVGYACKKGLKPESPNQDDYYILKVDDWSMYGVFDGHGPHGHHISAFVHKTLPFLIISDPEFESNVEACLMRAFRKVHQLVVAVSDLPNAIFDSSLSGTTATVVLQRDGKLIVAHCGDSRAVMGVCPDRASRSWLASDLTADHKPTLPSEKKRIESQGGEVKKLEGDIPHRVFVRNRHYPGLAMSRAIGDGIGASVGVSHEPEVNTYDLPADSIFVVATDGVWEFIDGQEAIDILTAQPPQKVNEAAEALAYESWRRWVEEEDNVVDDVTCIVVWSSIVA